jgi:hypothetical protein
MVAIRNGIGSNTSNKSRKAHPSWLVRLPLAISFFLVATFSFYGGVWVGMQTGLNSESNSQHLRAADSKERRDSDEKEFTSRVEAEVKRRMAEKNNASGGDSTNKSGDKLRRFPNTISKFATGVSLVSKNDFLATFDYGIPKPPSKREHESDPGKDDVLMLYGSFSSLPNSAKDGAIYADGDGVIPHISAEEATTNCGGLNVIYTDTHDGLDQCIAIVGNYESYHIQRWMRIKPGGGSKMNTELPLAPVGRGLQTNGQDKFSAPTDKSALQNQAMIKTYLDRLDDTLAKLKPLAESCAGDDNTVIVLVCNTGQSDLLINQICAADARGFGDVVRQKTLVFATDEGMLEIALGLGLKAFYDDKIFEKVRLFMC